VTSKKSSLKLTPTTDAANAELFASLYGTSIRFDHKQHRWLIWDENRWSEDKTERVNQLMKRTARMRHKLAGELLRDEDGITEEGKKQVKWAMTSEGHYRIKAALELAKSQDPIRDAGEGWDADPLLFGAANGVVDLRTGKLRPELPEDRITKHSPISFDPEAKCPRFLQFIDEICCGNTGLANFLQRAIGYSLTGLTIEQCFFCCNGVGANGKSTLLEVLSYVFGEYAGNLPFSALELRDRNRFDLVMLVGARFVTAIETREGVRLNEQRIKALTGSDRITAEQKYKPAFTFLPTHKLWLAFNHPPTITDDSPAMWRRVRMIPFNREFRGDAADKNLPEKLRAEVPGILAWMAQGCLLWRGEGLGVPLAVADATDDYKTKSDHLEQFLDDCCERESSGVVNKIELFKRYKEWCGDIDEFFLSIQAFTQSMEKKGFQSDRIGTERTRVWRGLRLYRSFDTSLPQSTDTATQDSATT
jgi:putative DNA primase/helicase